MIMDDFVTQNAGGATFIELHSAICADMDGDGIPDFTTGKRFISENDVVDPGIFVFWGKPYSARTGAEKKFSWVRPTSGAWWR